MNLLEQLISHEQKQQQSQEPVRLKGFAVALFTVGQGFVPTAVERIGSGEFVYVFPPEALVAKQRYFAARDLLADWQDQANKASKAGA
jgi:hypothetical protein